ncbi:MAG: hypothetical protein IKV62_08690 [Bacteroidales bacterium]|nr:hypothetical protein [Bacteroidales bacterium]
MKENTHKGNKDNPNHEKLPVFRFILACIILLALMGPFAGLCFYLYVICEGGWFFIVCGVAIILMYLILIYICVSAYTSKGPIGKDITIDEDQVDSPSLDARSELLLGMMGAELLNKEIEKEKKESERHRYESLYWQEAARDKNRHD